jgi:hypothetical protein
VVLLGFIVSKPLLFPLFWFVKYCPPTNKSMGIEIRPGVVQHPTFYLLNAVQCQRLIKVEKALLLQCFDRSFQFSSVVLSSPLLPDFISFVTKPLLFILSAIPQ